MPTWWDRIADSISVAGLAYVKLCNVIIISLALSGEILNLCNCLMTMKAGKGKKENAGI